jgi:hypothetical protein
MNKSNRIEKSQLIAGTCALLIATASSHAGLQIPYTPDDSTLHLWHLNEPSAVYTSTDAVATSSITLTNIGWPTPSIPPYTNTTLGSPGFAGLGTCESGINKGHLLFGGAFPDVSQFRNPVSGAFTFEAVIKFDINPLGAIDAEIVAGDNPSGSINVRGWQWRIFNGVMEWNLLAGNGGDNDFKSTLPSTGANAAIAGAWYHVAVTYTGSSPTNSDPANQLTFYWTLLDANRVAADRLGQFTMTRPLDGSPLGTSTPNLGIGGSGRNFTGNVGNNEGLIGSIDEVRVSSVARGSNEMAFVTGGALNPPSFTTQPPTNILVAFGKTLTIAALVSGTPTLSYQWRQNGADLAAQTNLTLVISNVNFANAGSYQLVVTNLYGSKTSSVSLVTVGAAPNGLFNTGLDTNGVVSAGDIPDPHWTLYRSADQLYLGPNAPIFEYAFPIQFADPNGAFSPTNGISMWIGAAGNQGGQTFNSPVGQYIYRSTFLIDTADPTTVTVSGNLWVNGTISDILVNGKSTGTTLAPGGTLYVITYAITNGFVPGVNTLDFVENMTGSAITGLRVEVQSVGQALPPGLPVITNQPSNQVVRDGTVPPNNSRAEFSVVALGRPPLTYQWWANGASLAGATDRVLTFVNPTVGAQGTNFFVVVSNDSGSVTSQVASLTLVPSNQPPVAANFSSVAFQGATFTIQLSDVVQKSVDPDHDPISFVTSDFIGTNGLSSILQVGATLVYTPGIGYVGSDQFTYTISDDQGANAIGIVSILDLNTPPTNQMVAPGGSASFDVGLLAAPAGYSFQWQLNGTNIAGATTGQLAINNAQLANSGSYTLVVIDPLGQKWISPIVGLTVGIAGSGTGLTGDYYGYGNGTTNFTGLPTLTRLDPTVDFDFSTGSPDPSLPADLFQIRWHGQVQPLYGDTYIFSTTSDDGARLWVNGQLVVNRWQNQSATTASGTVALQAGQRYDVLMEYFENTSVASVQLSWSSIHQPPQVIPMTQLYPSVGLVSPALSASVNNQTSIVLNWAGTFMLQSAPSVSGPWTQTANSFIGPFITPVTGGQQTFYRLVDPISP